MRPGIHFERSGSSSVAISPSLLHLVNNPTLPLGMPGNASIDSPSNDCHRFKATMKWITKFIVLVLAVSAKASASYHPSNDSIEGLPPSGGDGVEDPWPVRYYVFNSQHQTLYMAYMDVHPKSPNGKTTILMHGKNYCGATWEATARVLLEIGYRVIMADQVGWCKSIKPTNYQYSLQQLSLNTYGLLQHLGVKENLTVMGHSIGGMTATRFALLYPANTTRLVLVDPVGLEDWKVKGVPYQNIDITYNYPGASKQLYFYPSIRASNVLWRELDNSVRQMGQHACLGLLWTQRRGIRKRYGAYHRCSVYPTYCV